MEAFNRKDHWERIYTTKELKDVSWFQPKPETSLNLIHELKIPFAEKIIDIGGGDSFLVDHLLDLGFEDITVLDISEAAIERAKRRLGKRSSNVKWIVADASNFKPPETYGLWHDRAAFHFLTSEDEIERYLRIAKQSIKIGGHLIMGTFSEKGPLKCSGIQIKQYSESSMTERFKMYFSKIRCFNVDHLTPFNTIQNFVFCVFKNL